MRSVPDVAPTLCGLIAAFSLAASVLLAPGPVEAGVGERPDVVRACDCIDQGSPPAEPVASARTGFEGHPKLDDRDRFAALEAIQLALSEVSDGSTYVWHANSGRLSGSVRPTESFKDSSGRICRRIVVALSTASFSRETDGLACRLESGTWRLGR
jgi:surface antigen